MFESPEDSPICSLAVLFYPIDNCSINRYSNKENAFCSISKIMLFCCKQNEITAEKQ